MNNNDIYDNNAHGEKIYEGGRGETRRRLAKAGKWALVLYGGIAVVAAIVLITLVVSLFRGPIIDVEREWNMTGHYSPNVYIREYYNAEAIEKKDNALKIVTNVGINFWYRCEKGHGYNVDCEYAKTKKEDGFKDFGALLYFANKDKIDKIAEQYGGKIIDEKEDGRKNYSFENDEDRVDFVSEVIGIRTIMPAEYICEEYISDENSSRANCEKVSPVYIDGKDLFAF
jgi:hypothetical protein